MLSSALVDAPATGCADIVDADVDTTGAGWAVLVKVGCAGRGGASGSLPTADDSGCGVVCSTPSISVDPDAAVCSARPVVSMSPMLFGAGVLDCKDKRSKLKGLSNLSHHP